MSQKPLKFKERECRFQVFQGGVRKVLEDRVGTETLLWLFLENSQQPQLPGSDCLACAGSSRYWEMGRKRVPASRSL